MSDAFTSTQSTRAPGFFKWEFRPAQYPVSERGRKSRSADFPVRSIVRTPTCTQFAARLCERSFLRTGKSALRPPSLTGYETQIFLEASCCGIKLHTRRRMFILDRVGLIFCFFITASWRGYEVNPTLFLLNLWDGCERYYAIKEHRVMPTYITMLRGLIV